MQPLGEVCASGFWFADFRFVLCGQVFVVCARKYFRRAEHLSQRQLGGFVFEREVSQDLWVADELIRSVQVLDDGGQRFDPVAGIQIMHAVNHAVGRRVDVAAHDALTAALAGEGGDALLKFRDVAHGGFYAGFDGLAQ